MLKVLVILACTVAVVFSTPLSLREGAPVDDAFIEKIKALEQDSLQFVANRLVSQLHISQEEADSYRLDFLRWISLNYLVNSTSPSASQGPFVPSLQVDEFWHNFILYTKKYNTWCYKYFGHFIHHVPEEESTDTAVTAHNKDWLKTVVLMKDLYGVNWLTAEHEDGSCGNCKSLDNDASCGSCTTSAGCTSTGSSNSIKGSCGNCGTSGSCKSQ